MYNPWMEAYGTQLVRLSWEKSAAFKIKILRNNFTLLHGVPIICYLYAYTLVVTL